MTETTSQLRQLLLALEAELRNLSLWQPTPPSPEALASTEPFCADTLCLSEWLQWLLIPRLHALLDGQRPLPSSCNVLAIAEQNFKELGLDSCELLRLIGEIDRLITHSP